MLNALSIVEDERCDRVGNLVRYCRSTAQMCRDAMVAVGKKQALQTRRWNCSHQGEVNFFRNRAIAFSAGKPQVASAGAGAFAESLGVEPVVLADHH